MAVEHNTDVQVLDRSNGCLVEMVSLETACRHLADVLRCGAGEVRNQLLSGVPVRTTGFHYEMTAIGMEYHKAQLTSH